MKWRNDAERYGILSILLHWLMLLLIVGVYSCIELRGYWPEGSAIREGMKTWHFMLGLSIFSLVWLRLALRRSAPSPLIAPPLPHWQHRLARAIHFALYAFMIAMPLGGWIMLSAADKPIPFWGLELPPLVAPSKDLAKQVKELHETIGVAGYALIGLHATVGLIHHYVRRDNTLLRMLPIVRSTR
ncbi:MAG: cytochrome b [Gammaproteobacteria bacterium]|nr:cytochrome b [Gammaproteobacteria bacterium]